MQKIRYFSFTGLGDVIHKDASNFINNAENNRTGKRKGNVNNSPVKTLQQSPFGSFAIVNADIVVAAISTRRHYRIQTEQQ